MPFYLVKTLDSVGEIETLEFEADACEIFSNGTLLLKRDREIIFGAVQQSWLRVLREDDAGEAEVKRNGGRRHR